MSLACVSELQDLKWMVRRALASTCCVHLALQVRPAPCVPLAPALLLG